MLGVSLHGQSLDQGLQQLTTDQQAFEAAAEKYVEEHLNEVKAMLNHSLEHDNDHDHHGHHHDEVTPDQLDAMAREQARYDYIRQHMGEYMETYFGAAEMMGSSVINTACDNGGFENGFQFYDGFISTVFAGSDSCVALDNSGNLAQFIPAVLPTPFRFNLESPGVDPYVDIDKVKFGNHSLRINTDRPSANACNGARGVDRITKTFIVTEETRDLTVWYAVALENPDGHSNTQPYFNIHCDRDPSNELCFDADIIRCDSTYLKPGCGTREVDVLDWTCHRFKIPEEFIDSIATLTIEVGDCGLTGHAGFAYIDGICEGCEGSALGTVTLSGEDFDGEVGIDYFSCDGKTATVCGGYTAPEICGDWAPLEITVPGYDISNVTIDTSTNTFCFDFPISNFEDEDECLEVYVDVVFAEGSFNLPFQLSNTIEICKDEYFTYEYSVFAGGCNRNTDPDDGNISDDYYFVYVEIGDVDNAPWQIGRELIDPYDGESGLSTIASGSGSAALELGQFLIQEGDWILTLRIGDCVYQEYISAPDYCSGCEVFHNVEISNVTCNTDGTWSFDIMVIGDYMPNTFTLAGSGGGSRSFNQTHTINTGLQIKPECETYKLSYMMDCDADFTICPPQPCSNDCEDLEVTIEEVQCSEPDAPYTPIIDIEYSGQGFLCFGTLPFGNNAGPALPGSSVSGSISSGQGIGPFLGDVQLTVYICDEPCTSTSCVPSEAKCFKTIYIPDPNVCAREREGGDRGKGDLGGREVIDERSQISIVPNPILDDALSIRSDFEQTTYAIYSLDGRQVAAGVATGSSIQVDFPYNSGLYIIRCTGADGFSRTVKVLKH